MDDCDLVVEKRKGSYDYPLLGSFKRSVGPLVLDIEEGTDGVGSYDNNKKVRAGSYQVDPIARIVVKPKDKYAKIGTIRDSKMIKEEVGEESDDDEK
jgi:hypothetical protein